MDVKLVFLCVVCVALVAGNTINRDHIRKTIHENLMKRMHGGGQGGGQGGNQGQGQDQDREPNIFRKGKMAIRRLEDIVDIITRYIDLIVSLGEEVSDEEQAMFLMSLSEFIEDAENLGELLESLEEFFEQAGESDATTEDTTEAPPTTEAEDTTAANAGTTAAGPATDSGTTEAEDTTAANPNTAAAGGTTAAAGGTTAAAGGTTAADAGTTAAAPGGRRFILRKTLLRALLNKLREKSHK
ncbi:uncharacterized protein LOC132740936 [Ruditapes philippinarum]|uniref:uncharacterized protein LOC132740936 n=1 Tax=Ruditapes philippinarum TaxID=129788 RepID=UPI00295BAB57|nr:uncharacterized protein LOC132740936 [Ruditapes philippinarum]